MLTRDVDLPAGLDRVPPFPAVATRLLNLLKSQDVDTALVTELIATDAALTARLIQFANSALCGAVRAITDVHHAISHLGFDQTRQLVITIATAAYARRAPNEAELQRCWQHSLATAVLAEEISKACDVFSATIFTAGVLHDIGRLGLMLAFPLKYGQAVREARPPRNLLAIERSAFGLEHTEAGRMLLESWQMPPEFRPVVAHHHDPGLLGDRSLLGTIHLACRMADSLGFGIIPVRGDGEFATLLEALPSALRKRLANGPMELRNLVYDRIEKVFVPAQKPFVSHRPA